MSAEFLTIELNWIAYTHESIESVTARSKVLKKPVGSYGMNIQGFLKNVVSTKY